MQSLPSRHKRHIDVNSVSLVGLKAEIARRQGEVKAKAVTIPNVGGAVLKGPGGGAGVNSLLKKPPPVPPKPKKNDKPPESDEASEKEDAEWDKARRNLEAKARLYDALRQAASSGSHVSDYDDEKAPLVDFERKAMEARNHGSNSSDEDADYDKRGRYKDRRSASPVKRAEPVHIPDGPVTYAHLRQGEVREHGTGFYAFSADAAQREAEQAALRELRRRTEAERARVEADRATRSVALANRLARLRARKGLPDVATAAASLLDSAPSESEPSDQPPSSPPPVVGEALGSDDLDIVSMLRRLRDEAEEKQAASAAPAAVVVVSDPVKERETLPQPPGWGGGAKKRPTREWDRGKALIPPPAPSSVAPRAPKMRKFGEKRGGGGDDEEERDPEFAPPSCYH